MSALVSTSGIAVFPYEPPWLAVILLLGFLLFMGAAVGSFLNVVIYRVPAGLSIVRPRSRCPKCFTPILARDNLPVVGWLLLRGKCRFCKAPIAARYPLVEAAAGGVFTSLCLGEAVFGGFTLPIPRGMSDGYPLFGIAVYHFALLCGLGAAALMTYDRAVVPVEFWRIILLFGLLPPLMFPDLRPVPFHGGVDAFGRLAVGAADGALGALLGALLGACSWPVAVINARARSGHLNSVAALACVGAFLGWQAAAAAAIVVVLMTFALALFRVVVAGASFPWLGFVFATTLALILGWRWSAAHITFRGVYFLGPESPAWFAAASAALVFALSLAARTLHFAGAAAVTTTHDRSVPASTH